jgi:hypothetical protein
MSFFTLQNDDSPMNLTEKLAIHMTHSLANKLGSPCVVPKYDLSWDVLKDAEMIVAQAHRAYSNPGRCKFPQPAAFTDQYKC